MLFHKILQDLKQKIVAQGAYKVVVSEVLSQELGTPVAPDTVVSLRDGVLTLMLQPTLKLLLNTKRDRIIALLQSRGVSVQVIR